MRLGQKIGIARRLRQRETDFERRLWKELRDRRVHGLKFSGQHAVSSYVVDFACLEARLLIEIDGYWHAFRKAEDKERDRVLRASGFDVVRYDIENEPANPLTLAEAIAHEAASVSAAERTGALTPNPSPAGGRGEHEATRL